VRYAGCEFPTLSAEHLVANFRPIGFCPGSTCRDRSSSAATDSKLGKRYRTMEMYIPLAAAGKNPVGHSYLV